MEPARTIIDYIGGAKAVAEIVGKHPSRVYRWAYPNEKREGCGGIVPLKDQQRLLDHCQRFGIDLLRDDFFSHDRIALILAKRSDNSPASSSAGDDAGAPVTPPAQSGAPAANSDSHAIKGACETGGQLRPETALLPIIHSKSPEVLPSGETGAQFMGMGCAPASASREVLR